MKQFTVVIFILIAIALFSQHSFAQEVVLNDDVLFQTNGEFLEQPADTLMVEEPPAGRTILEVPVQYSAQDSIVMFPRSRMGHLFGSASVQYGVTTITGEYITTDMNISEITATFGVDSLGVEFGFPVLTEPSGEYEMRTVRYNFVTRRAFINQIITQEGEGHVIAAEARKNPDGSFFMRNARYTTCPQHDNPHFFLNLSRAVVRPGEDVVTGPAWLVVAGLPLFPVVVPFAFFPFTDTFSSGVIMPSYGQEMHRGFFLHNGGYYFAINDFVDLAVTGEITTRGTWGIGARSSYRRRYRYSGSFDFYFVNFAHGDRSLRHLPPPETGRPFFYRTRDFRLSATHSQDPASNMFRTISMSVSFATVGGRRNDLNQQFTRASANNTTSSSVNITQRFPDSPWSLSANMQMTQNTRDSIISATLPNLSVTMNRINPFRRQNAVGAQRWYERITLNYSGEFRNTITTHQNQFFRSHLINDWTNGMQHRAQMQATFSLFDVIQISPSINYTERWYTGGFREAWNPVTQRHERVDTVRTFSRVWNYNASISAQTRLYGMFVPWAIFGDRVQAIRHVFSPSIGLSYSPDFENPRFGFWRYYYFRNQHGDDVRHVYSPYTGMVFGTAPRGRQGNINFAFQNNVEARIRDRDDPSGSRRISLIDDLGISFSYNMVAQQHAWSMINSNLRLRFGQQRTFSLSAAWDPYFWELNERGDPFRSNNLRIRHGRGIARFQGTHTSFSQSINNNTFRDLFSGGGRNRNGNGNGNGSGNGDLLPDDGTIGRNPNEYGVRTGAQVAAAAAQGYDADGFMINPLNWNLSFNYSIRYALTGGFDKVRMEHRGQLTHNLGMNGSIQPTANWNITFNADYNFELRQVTNMMASITRRMCCWSMSASIVPFGPWRNYMFTVRADASLLRDLKYDQRSSRGGGTRWY